MSIPHALYRGNEFPYLLRVDGFALTMLRLLCCSCKRRRRRRRVGDSSTSIVSQKSRMTQTDSLQQVQVSPQRLSAADTRPVAAPPPAVIYQQVEVTPSPREQSVVSAQPQPDDDVADGDEQTPPAKGPIVSKTPRDGASIRQLQSRLPDRFEGSSNVRPGSVWQASVYDNLRSL